MSSSEEPDPTSVNATQGPAGKPEKLSFFAELRRRKVFRVAATYVIVAWIIIQVAAATFPGFEIPMWAFRFVVMMIVLGFPVALLLAWAFELTPDGIKLTQNVSEEEKAVTSQAKRNWTSVIFAAVLPTVIFGVLAVFFFFKVERVTTEMEEVVAAQQVARDKSIAVLPFENRSNRDEDQFFTDGIHDDLLTQISRIHDIKTISRTSVLGYRDTTKNMREIGEELKVANILEGGVQRSGNRVRINMQLINAATDAHIWAETYTRELTAENVFEIQSEIALAIARELKAILSPAEKERLEKLPTQNLEALEAYFKGITTDYSTDSIEQGIEYLKRAVELDPDFALAQARLAHAYQSQIWYGGLPFSEQVDKARPHLEKAIELDPELSEAWVVKGLIERDLGDFEAAEDAYQRAIAHGPNNDSAYNNYSILLYWDLGKLDRALEMIDKAIELNPDDPDPRSTKAEYLSREGRIAEADAIWQSLGSGYPNNARVQLGVGNHQVNQGRYDEAFKAFRKAHYLDPKNATCIMGLTDCAYYLRDTERRWFWRERGLSHYPDSEWEIAWRLFLLTTEGRREEAGDFWLAAYRAGNMRPGFHREAATGFLSEADLQAGEPEKVIDRYRLMFPELSLQNSLNPIESTGIQSSHQYAFTKLVPAYRMIGEPEKAEALIKTYREAFVDGHDQPFAEIVYHVMAGNFDDARTVMESHPETALSNEFSMHFMREFSQDNWVAARLEKADAQLREMRENVAEMDARSELAPIPEL